MLKVLQVINSLSSGGAEVFVSQLSVALSKACKVKLLTYAGELDNKGVELKEYLTRHGVIYQTISAKSTLQKILLPIKYAQIIKEWKPDIVHVHLPRSEQIIFLSSFFHMSKIITIKTKHDEMACGLSLFDRKLNEYYSNTIACSPSSLSPLLKVGLNKATLIKNGIELNTISRLSGKERMVLRNRLGLSEDQIVLVNVGRMYRAESGFQKAQDIIIQATRIIQAKQNCTVIFLGDGAGRKELEDMVIQLGVGQSISFKGIVNNVKDFLYCADALLMPSRTEGLPISAIEAACSGLPMIVSDIDSFSEFATKSVIRCVAGSPECLAEAVFQFIEKKNEFKERAVIDAEYYKEKFSIDNVARKHLDLYEHLISTMR